MKSKGLTLLVAAAVLLPMTAAMAAPKPRTAKPPTVLATYLAAKPGVTVNRTGSTPPAAPAVPPSCAKTVSAC